MMERIIMEITEVKKYLLLQKEVFTLKEFCLYAGLSEDHAYKLTSSGRIRFYRPFGKKIYIKKEDAIQALLSNPVSSVDQNEKVATDYLFHSEKKMRA